MDLEDNLRRLRIRCENIPYPSFAQNRALGLCLNGNGLLGIWIMLMSSWNLHAYDANISHPSVFCLLLTSAANLLLHNPEIQRCYHQRRPWTSSTHRWSSHLASTRSSLIIASPHPTSVFHPASHLFTYQNYGGLRIYFLHNAKLTTRPGKSGPSQ
jgi:hypothetical protein